MGKKVQIPIPVNITKEKLRKKDVFIAETPLFNVASQGFSIEEAIKHLQEALICYWKEPHSKKILGFRETQIFAGELRLSFPKKVIENVKATHSIRD